jgi:hypothetical protein
LLKAIIQCQNEGLEGQSWGLQAYMNNGFKRRRHRAAEDLSNTTQPAFDLSNQALQAGKADGIAIHSLTVRLASLERFQTAFGAGGLDRAQLLRVQAGNFRMAATTLKERLARRNA